MEQDRYQESHTFFIIGMICLLLSLVLLAMTVYLLPHLLWRWRYDVPEFVFFWHEWLINQYDMSESAADWIIFFVFLTPTIVCAIIAYISSNRIDNKIYGIAPEKKEISSDIKQDVKQSASLGLKILVLIAIVIIGTAIFEWIISVPPPPQ